MKQTPEVTSSFSETCALFTSLIVLSIFGLLGMPQAQRVFSPFLAEVSKQSPSPFSQFQVLSCCEDVFSPFQSNVVQQNFLQFWNSSMSALSNKVAISLIWFLSTCNMISVIKELNLQLHVASDHHIEQSSSRQFKILVHRTQSTLATASLAGLPSEGTIEVMYLMMSYILIGS